MAGLQIGVGLGAIIGWIAALWVLRKERGYVRFGKEGGMLIVSWMLIGGLIGLVGNVIVQIILS